MMKRPMKTILCGELAERLRRNVISDVHNKKDNDGRTNNQEKMEKCCEGKKGREEMNCLVKVHI